MKDTREEPMEAFKVVYIRTDKRQFLTAVIADSHSDAVIKAIENRPPFTAKVWVNGKLFEITK
jgi:hypothetical protein